jgi:hypothetical protein
MYKKLTEIDIKDAFLKLINENGTTSNKEVKDYLRGEGFWAFQSTVKDFIDANFEDLGADRTYNGKYNIYTLSQDDIEDEDDDTFDDEEEDEDDDNDIVVNVKVFTARQLKFRKDSNTELFSKVRNPKYVQYKNDIEKVLKQRGVHL